MWKASTFGWRRVLLLELTAFAVAVGGCSNDESPDASPRGVEGWRQIRLPDANPDRVYEAGVHALRQWFPRLDTRHGQLTIAALPVEYTQEGGTDRLRDSLRYHNRLRRTATVVVQPQDNICVVKCRVDRERLDTSDHRIFHQQEGPNDVPNQTPIDKDAGVTDEQNQAWTPVARDRELEQQILDSIREQVTGEKPLRPAVQSGGESARETSTPAGG